MLTTDFFTVPTCGGSKDAHFLSYHIFGAGDIKTEHLKWPFHVSLPYQLTSYIHE